MIEEIIIDFMEKKCADLSMARNNVSEFSLNQKELQELTNKIKCLKNIKTFSG